MAKAKRGFWDAWKISSSVDDVLKYKGWEEAHTAGGKVNPDYKIGVAQLIESNLPNGGDTKDKSTLEKNLRDLERKLAQPRLPIPQEMIPEQSPEELICLLEKRWPDGLWTDKKTGEVITVNHLVAEPDRFREAALELFHDRADKLKRGWQNANWDLSVLTNLLACIDKIAPPTEQELADFYSTVEWKRANAVARDRDGAFCVDCGNAEGPFIVHHKVPIRQCWLLRCVQSNLEHRCYECHGQVHRDNDLAEAAE